MSPWILAATLAVLQPAAAPQTAGRRVEIGGHVSLTADALPRRDAAELRPQAGVRVAVDLGGPWRARFDGFAEALAADRGGAVTAAGVRVREAWIEAAGDRGDLRVGFGRIVWGRLDEIQPSDVINPIDAARFVFDGRSAARLPVALVRGRLFAGERLVVEGVLAPVFRRATFDELDEDSSPFNLVNDLILPAGVSAAAAGIDRDAPARAWRNVSGGARVSATIGRVDVAGGVYRGHEGFGLVAFEPLPGIQPAVVGRLVERYPRFTMVSGDFEAVAGAWELRGEAALFTEKWFQATGAPGMVRGRSFDAGIGANRASGPWRVFVSAIVHRQWADAHPDVARTDVTVVGSVDRTLGRERWLLRLFGAATPGDRSGFLRGVLAWKATDDVGLEVSGALFQGRGETALGRFEGRDFVLARLRYDW